MKRWILLCLVSCIFLTIGCSKKPGDITYQQLDYTLPNQEEIPSTLRQQIQLAKAYPFTMEYKQGEDLFLAVGYGQKPTGGYSVQVVAIGEAQGRVQVVTKLIAPSPDEYVTTVITYPIIVIQIKDPGVPIEFKTSIPTLKK